jgi:hypothetical protein
MGIGSGLMAAVVVRIPAPKKSTPNPKPKPAKPKTPKAAKSHKPKANVVRKVRVGPIYRGFRAVNPVSRAAQHRMPRGSGMATKVKVTVELPETVHRLLEQAAARRRQSENVSMSLDTLIMQIVGGIVCRGSIENALHAWGRYCADHRAVGAAQVKRIELDANAHEQAAQVAEV